MTMIKPQFPFTAISGQLQFKQALLLNAIDPRIGGLLVSGPRGLAKSTTVRAFSEILHQQNEQAHFTALPLGASEEMLIGTLDIERVMQDQQVDFRPGLLQKAHQGVLYVDEINLLADNLIDLLLDVSASGTNHVERDGISHAHASEFILIGTMNPDEGELRPQLLDRFGLMVDLDGDMTIDQRIDIVDRRHAFDQDANAFCQKFAREQAQIVKQVINAKQLLLTVALATDMKRHIAEICQASGADGIRADLVMTRAAKAHCAWQGRVCVEAIDIEAVAEMVLCHRRQSKVDNNSSTQPPSSNNDSGFKRPPKSRPNTEAVDGADQSQGDWGSMSADSQTSADDVAQVIPNFNEKINGSLKHVVSRKKARNRGSVRLGAHNFCSSTSIDWFKTLIKTADRLPPKALVYQKKRSGKDQLHCVLLDTSGSTLNNHVLKQAKGFVLAVQKKAYLAREKLCVFSFGNQQIKEVHRISKSPKSFESTINAVKAGGGTPLNAMLNKASVLLNKTLRLYPGLSITTYIVTDGRTNQSVEGINLPGSILVVDTDAGPLNIGRCREMAKALDATYMSLTA